MKEKISDVILNENVDSVDQDQTARCVQSDLDLLCPQKASCVVSSKERVKSFAKNNDHL